MSSGGDLLPHEAYLGVLAGLDGLGPATLRRLLQGRSPQEVWEAVRRGAVAPLLTEPIPPVTRSAMGSWSKAARSVDVARRWEQWRRAGIGVVSLGQPGYPACLVEDPDPPVVLFHRGDPDVLASRRVAIVGTRRATGYGRRIAHDLGRALAGEGVCVVSGLALGIDAAAHRGALAGRPDAAAEGHCGPAAVVGGGVDAPGPVSNAPLAREVVEHGVVLSEVAPRTPPAPWRFPVRNRILAGLAEVVVVVESAVTGGSMSTVEEAQRRGRTVLAVPGPVDSAGSSGTNRLIADGALVCTCVDDVHVALGWTASERFRTGDAPAVHVERRPLPSGDAATVLDLLGFSPVSIEVLARESDLDLARLSVAIGALESAEWVRRSGPFVERVAQEPVRGDGALRS